MAKDRRIDRHANRTAESEAARQRAAKAAGNALPRLAPADPRRRKRLERDPAKWLKYYFPDIFVLPFSDGHRAIIKAVVFGDKSGKDVVVAAPRGEGKTNLLRFLSIYLVFTERARFVVDGSWQNRAADEAFSTWLIALTSERLAADYPEYCTPFCESTHANRLPRLYWADDANKAPTGAAVKSKKMQIVFPDGRGALAAGSLQGDIKGLNITTRGGQSLRPDKLLLDDPQDVDRADDPVFVSETVHRIDSQWRCLAGPSTRISMMVACTIYAPNDVGETLGKRRDAVFVRIPRVTSWPEGFDKADSPCRQMWDKWFDLYCDDKTRGESFRFYRANKSAMCDGFAVSWKERYDRAKGDPDALFAAMVDYYTKGRDAFFSEYQNSPVARNTKLYEITPRRVLEHRVALPDGVVPDDAVYTVLTTDINYSYGLTYQVTSFRRDRTSHVVTEGVWCEAPLPISAKDSNQMQRQAAVRLALERMAAWVERQPWKVDQWYIDAGGEQFETVTTFCRTAKHEGRLGRAMIGRSGKTYNPNTRTQVGRVRGHVYQCFTRESGKWYCFDADFHKEGAQTSWITPAGQPGSATLCEGPHRDYADQMCREVLEAKGVLETRTGVATGYAYKWNTLPGKHDKLDCHAMAQAAAAHEGILGSDGDARPLATHGEGGESRATGRNRRRVYNG